MRLVWLAGCFLTATLLVAPVTTLAEDETSAQEMAPAFGTPGATTEWNQEKVAALADELATAVHDVRRTAKRVPGPGIQSGQERAWMIFDEKLKKLETESKVMARQLKEGKTHDETLKRYQRMGMLVRDLNETARRMEITKDLQAQIDAARTILDKFDAYYA